MEQLLEAAFFGFGLFCLQYVRGEGMKGAVKLEKLLSSNNSLKTLSDCIAVTMLDAQTTKIKKLSLPQLLAPDNCFLAERRRAFESSPHRNNNSQHRYMDLCGAAQHFTLILLRIPQIYCLEPYYLIRGAIVNIVKKLFVLSATIGGIFACKALNGPSSLSFNPFDYVDDSVWHLTEPWIFVKRFCIWTKDKHQQIYYSLNLLLLMVAPNLVSFSTLQRWTLVEDACEIGRLRDICL